jgi:hypothetical protein
MIGTSRLAAFSQYTIEQEPETIDIFPPWSVGNLPEEWQSKVGHYEFPAFKVVELRDVSLCGPALVGIRNGDVVLDAGYYGRLDLWERNAPYFEMAMQAIRQPGIEIDTAISLVGCWSGNYFHWLLDDLTRLEGLKLYQIKRSFEPTILAPSNISFVDESLAKWFPNSEIIKVPFGNNHYRVKRLVVVTTRRSKGRVAPSALAYLRGLSADTPEAYTSKKVYVSRRLARSRRVVNEEDVAEALLKKGFTILQSEILGFDEQVQRFANAEWVIGAHGAGLANIVWNKRPKQLKVIELATPAYSNPCCWLIGAGMGADYGVMMCKPVGDEDLEVDIDKLLQLMELM